ncbi:MAG: response regulator [Alphaproteobacteria bacterium]|nr:response regulator [Alphaproteobacteria bacterium]MCB9699705.1 response regulator [Alphaproteobacteria bacterium]
MRTLAVVSAAAWLLFAALYLVEGHLRVAALDLAVAAGMLVSWTVAGRGARWAGAALLCGNLLGLLGVAAWSGQDRAMATWYLAALPLAAAWVGDRRATLGWSAAAAAAVIAIHGSVRIVPLTPEFVSVGAEVAFGQIALVGVVTWVSAVVREVYDQQAAALAEARDAALAEARAKDRLLEGLGHELRTPLHAILTLSDHLGATLQDPHQRRSVDTVHRSASNLLAVIETVLRHQERKGDEGPVEILDVVEGVLDVLAVEAANRRVELVWRCERSVPDRILVDAAPFEQLVGHLVSHAVGHARDGFVEVRVTRSGVHAVVLDVEFTRRDDTRDGDVRLALALGEDLARRLDATIATVAPSSGGMHCLRAEIPVDEISSLPGRNAVGQRVGLLVAEERTRSAITAVLEGWGVVVATEPTALQDTDVVVVSATWPDWRSVAAEVDGRFALLVDAASPAPDDLPAPARLLRLPFRRSEWMEMLAEDRHRARLAPRLAPMRILVVEDDPINQEILVLLLSGLGQRPDVVDDGPPAVATACAQPFDVVLMDLRLPTFDGIEAIRRIRADATHQPRILVVSASVTPAQRAACVAAGADGFVDKPIDAGRLLDGLRGSLPDPVDTVVSADEVAADKALRDLTVLAGDGRDAMLRDFLATASELVEEIATCVARRDTEGVARCAHRLRGSASMYGAPEVTRLAAAMEDAVREGGSPTEVEAIALRAALETARRRIHRRMSDGP